MERSDPPRPAAADSAAAKPEPQHPAAGGEGTPATDNTQPPSTPPPELAPFTEAEPERVERTSFEDLERETTQPVRRYFEHVDPAEVAYAVDYEVPTVDAYPHVHSAPVDEPQQFEREELPTATASDELSNAPFEPWPDPMESTRSPSRDMREQPVTGVDPQPSTAQIDDEVSAVPPYEPSPTDPPQRQSGGRAFEPSPFNVPLVDSWAPKLPVSHEVRYAESASPLPPEEPQPEPAISQECEAAVAPAPQPEPEPAAHVYVTAPAPSASPPQTLRHDIDDAWAPSPGVRREPTFDRLTPRLHADAPTAPEFVPAPQRRDWRDLFRRAANVAFLVFGGWFLAVLLLIAAYRFVNPPFSTLMALQWISGTPIHKEWVPLERISPNLTQAVIVAEDGRFCDHWGVDFIEAAHAIRRATDGYPRGASTITMQVAKNLFLLPTKSYLRKMLEIPLTFIIELAWPKWRILEIYLNIVEWGPGVFGAEAASRSHFGRPAMTLTSRQAAQLAVALPNPIIRDAGSPGPRTSHRASIIQARAARAREASYCVDGRR
jgi:monofunctional biosynthetic peptidoglycan transglycosylase